MFCEKSDASVMNMTCGLVLVRVINLNHAETELQPDTLLTRSIMAETNVQRRYYFRAIKTRLYEII